MPLLMVTFDQVMLPYMSAGGGRTVYELFRAEQLALPPGDVIDAELVG